MNTPTADRHTHCTCDKYQQPFDSKLSVLCSYCQQEARREADLRAMPKRFPLVAADRRSGDDRRVNVEHALALPMPKRGPTFKGKPLNVTPFEMGAQILEDRRVDQAYADGYAQGEKHATARATVRTLSDPQAIEASVQHLMRLARECAHRQANEANWLGLEAAIRKALTTSQRGRL